MAIYAPPFQFYQTAYQLPPPHPPLRHYIYAHPSCGMGIAIEFPENCMNLVKCAIYTFFMEDGVINSMNLGERTLFEGRMFDNFFNLLYINHPKHWNAYVYRVQATVDITLTKFVTELRVMFQEWQFCRGVLPKI